MNEQNKAKLNKFWGIWNFLESVILLASGILAIVVAFLSGDNEALSNMNMESIVAYVASAFVLLDGILRIVMSFVHYRGPKNTDESGMLVGGFELTIGIVMVLLEVHFYLLTNQHVFTYFIANFIASLLIVIGLLLIIFSIVTIAKKYGGLFMPILEIMFSAILVGVGVTIFILYYRQNNTNIVLVLTGSILCIASIAQMIITIITLKKAKKEDKDCTQSIIIEHQDCSTRPYPNAKEVYVDMTGAPSKDKKDDTKLIDSSKTIEQIEGPKE